jgi:hypothetical protein
MIYTIKANSLEEKFEQGIKAIEIDEDFLETPEGSSRITFIDMFDIKKTIVVDTNEFVTLINLIINKFK